MSLPYLPILPHPTQTRPALSYPSSYLYPYLYPYLYHYPYLTNPFTQSRAESWRAESWELGAGS